MNGVNRQDAKSAKSAKKDKDEDRGGSETQSEF